MNPLVILVPLALGGYFAFRKRPLAQDPTKLDTTNLGCDFTEVDLDQFGKANHILIRIEPNGDATYFLAVGDPGGIAGTELLWRTHEKFLRARSPSNEWVVDELTTVTLCNWIAQGKPAFTCSLPTDFMIFQANQAALSGDPGLILAVANYFRSHGCLAEATLLESNSNLVTKPWPAETVLTSTPPPMPLGKDQIWLEPGAHYRASAILGALGCAIPLSAIQEKLEAKGFSQVKLWSENPWDGSWQPPDGFLECSRFGEVVWTGPPKAEKLPSQIWKIQKV